MPDVSPAKALTMLRSAIVNARIYPKGSQMVDVSIKGALEAFQAALESASAITVTDAQGKLLVDGKDAPEARDFRPFLVSHEIQSLRFTKGVELAEMTTLVEGLGRKKGQYDTKPNFKEWLKGQNVSHVLVEEVQFVALQKGDVVVQQITQLLEQNSHDVPSLISSLDESVRLMDQLPDDKSKQEARKHMAHHLSTLPPHQLRELFENKLPENVEKAGLRDDVVQAMTREKLEETLEEVHKWYDQIKQSAASDLEAVEKLNGLKSFLGKILHSPASKNVSFAMYEELLNVGLLEEIPQGVQKGERSSLNAQVEQLLSMPSASLLDPPVRQNFPELLKALCGMGMDEALQKLTDKMMENLKNTAPLMRETAVKTLKLFQDTFASNRKEKQFLAIVSAFRQMADQESSPEVYHQVATALQAAAMEMLVGWKFEESALLLALLRRHSREESPISQKKKQFAARALQEFAAKGLDTLCADINASVKERQEGSYKVLAELGEDAVPSLIEAMKRSMDPRTKQAAAQALKRLGTAAKDPLVKQMTLNTPADVLVKLVPILEEFVDTSLLPTLTALSQHAEPLVRRQVARLLARVQDTKAQALLFAMLGDSDPEAQTEIIRMIGDLKIAAAVPELIKHLPTAYPSAQEEICITFGTLKDKRTIPELIKLLQNHGSFWKKSSGTPESTRVRIVWALGQMMPDVEAEKALQKAQKDSAMVVQRAAQNALSKSLSPAR